MDKYVRTNVKIKYTIMKDDEYFNGCRTIGVDSNNIFKISRTQWSKALTPESLRMSLERAEKMLQGILTYDMDKDSKYKIVEITVTTNTEVNELGDEYNELINPFGDSRFGG